MSQQVKVWSLQWCLPCSCQGSSVTDGLWDRGLQQGSSKAPTLRGSGMCQEMLTACLSIPRAAGPVCICALHSGLGSGPVPVLPCKAGWKSLCFTPSVWMRSHWNKADLCSPPKAPAGHRTHRAEPSLSSGVCSAV